MSRESLLVKVPGTIRCNSPECLGNPHYLTSEHKMSRKGQVTLYCNLCGLKHFVGDPRHLRALAVHQASLPPRVHPATYEVSAIEAGDFDGDLEENPHATGGTQIEDLA